MLDNPVYGSIDVYNLPFDIFKYYQLPRYGQLINNCYTNFSDSRRSRDREIAPSSEEDYLVENRSVSPRSKKLSKNDVRMHHAPQRPPPPRNADDYLYE